MPPAVLELIGDPTKVDGDDWFRRDLTINELRATVAAINATIRPLGTHSLER